MLPACHQIADIDLALGDRALERRGDLPELFEGLQPVDLALGELDLGIGRHQLRFGALVTGLLVLGLLLRDDALGESFQRL
ncbi:MAG: hypothetical protein WDN69_16615 [Aliidongia sp.]